MPTDQFRIWEKRNINTIEEAKVDSLKKWEKVRRTLTNLLKQVNKPCGFCAYYGHCNECEARQKCQEQDLQVSAFLHGSLAYIEDTLIPYIEDFEPLADL